MGQDASGGLLVRILRMERQTSMLSTNKKHEENEAIETLKLILGAATVQ